MNPDARTRLDLLLLTIGNNIMRFARDAGVKVDRVSDVEQARALLVEIGTELDAAYAVEHETLTKFAQEQEKVAALARENAALREAQEHVIQVANDLESSYSGYQTWDFYGVIKGLAKRARAVVASHVGTEGAKP